MPPALARIARHFWNSSLVCQVISEVYYFIRFFSFFRIFFPFFLSYCKTVLKMPSVSKTSNNFLGKVSVVIRKSQMRTFQFILWGYLRRFNIASLGSDNLRKKGSQKGKGFRFWFVFFNFCNWLPVTHILISMNFRWTYNCLVKNIHRC